MRRLNSKSIRYYAREKFVLELLQILLSLTSIIFLAIFPLTSLLTYKSTYFYITFLAP